MTPLDLIAQDYLGCGWAEAPYFLFSENVERLVYYSHLFPAIAGMILAVLILVRHRRSLTSYIIAFIAMAFSVFSIIDLILWATERPSLTMFLWSSLIYIEPLIYAAALYLVYVFIDGRDVTLKLKLIAAGLIAPIIILAPTSLNLLGFDYSNCDRLALEGPLWYYVYLVELIFVGWIAALVSRRALQPANRTRRTQILLLGLGNVLFLLTFSWGNIVGSITDDWTLGQYGLFGMPILLAFLIYLIVRFRSFNVEILNAEALVLTVWTLLLSLIFLRSIVSVRVIVIGTLLLFTYFGYRLVRSVRREFEQRKHIENMAKYLTRANARLRTLDKQKTEFVSIASHQLRSPLTAITGYSSLMLEGSYGEVPPTLQAPIEKMYQSSKLMAISIEDFLNVARIEQGRMKYDIKIFNICDVVCKTVEELDFIAREKGLDLSCTCPSEDAYLVRADPGKVKQIMTNLVDNAIKYTPQGSVRIFAEHLPEEKRVRITIKDTGIGLAKADIEKLFLKFSRAENSSVASVSGTGLGLFIVKQMTKAMGGSVWIESEGENKGSAVVVELPSSELSDEGTHEREEIHRAPTIFP